MSYVGKNSTTRFRKADRPLLTLCGMEVCNQELLVDFAHQLLLVSLHCPPKVGTTSPLLYQVQAAHTCI